ncbi:hypothetical protein PINS_up000526 [Pythium insidiosum]|nr:hypothetical protein PINS_up000526 [Pythium insidiosum]
MTGDWNQFGHIEKQRQQRLRFIATPWLVLYLTMNASVFGIRFSQFPLDACAGWWPAIAKGSAEVVLLNSTLALVACSRQLVFDRLRSVLVPRVQSPRAAAFWSVATEASPTLHVLSGSMVLSMSLLHSAAWTVILVLIQDCELEGIAAKIRARVDVEHITALVRSLPVWTGMVMALCVVCFVPWVLLLQLRPRFFRAFTSAHRALVTPLVPLLLVHGLARWSGAPQTAFWLAPSMLLVFLERRQRLCAVRVAIEHCERVDDTLTLYLSKPSGPKWQTLRAGAFVYVQISGISRLEWHPFSISSAAHDEGLVLRLRLVGRWTKALGACVDGVPHVCLDGPYGTSSEWLYSAAFDDVWLVAAGMGITPFLAVLRSHLLETRSTSSSSSARSRTLRLVWVLRDEAMLRWLHDVVTGCDVSVLAAVRWDVFLTRPVAVEAPAATTIASVGLETLPGLVLHRPRAAAGLARSAAARGGSARDCSPSDLRVRPSSCRSERTDGGACVGACL